MQFRQGQRDDRRRRVFTEAQWTAAPTPRRRSLRWERPDRRSEHYGDGEFLDRLPRLVDFVPVRWTIVFSWVIVGLATIAGIEGLYLWMPKSPMAIGGKVQAFDLEAPANLAVWFSTSVLSLAGAMALIVYSVRRHRRDDYHGHYRVWIWAALCCFLLSVDQGANLREALKDLIVRLSGAPLWGDGSLWWVLIYGLILGAVGTRLAVDMFACRLSTLMLAAAAACYGVVAAGRFGGLTAPSAQQQLLLLAGSTMLGNLLVLLAMLFHARHVLLDAEGLLPQRRPIAQEDLDNEEEERQVGTDPSPLPAAPAAPLLAPNPSPGVVVHPPHGLPRPTSPGFATAPSSPGPPQSLAQAEASVGRKLTKAERKALQQRLARMQAQRQKRAG